MLIFPTLVLSSESTNVTRSGIAYLGKVPASTASPTRSADFICRQAIAPFSARNDERMRPLTPTSVRQGDHRHLLHAWMGRDQAFERQGRYPLTAGLDDVLDAILQLQVTVGIDRTDVLGVQIAASPEFFGGFRVSDVARRRPRRTHDDLANRFAIVRQCGSGRIDNLQVDQGPAAPPDSGVVVRRILGGFQVDRAVVIPT